MRIKHRLIAIGAISLSLALLVCALAYYNIGQVRADLDTFAQNAEKTERLARLDSLIEGIPVPFNGVIVAMMMGEDPEPGFALFDKKVTELKAISSELKASGADQGIMGALSGLEKGLASGRALLVDEDAYGASEFYLSTLKGAIVKVQAQKQRITDAQKAAFAQSREEGEEAYRTNGLIAVVLVGGALVIAMAVIFLTAKRIIGPLEKVVSMLGEMERGHIHSRLNLSGEDEIAQMACTMDRFTDCLEGEVIDALKRLSEGDLTFDVEPKDQNDLLRGALKKLGEDLNGIMAQIQVAGEKIAEGSGQVSDFSQVLCQGSVTQASSLEEISSSMNEMASQTQTNAENASEASNLSREARSAAAKGNEQMLQMTEAMSEVNQSSHDISRIIKVIDEIAFQTNLLALNAAVEAARAGQHGKGFAVVAEEVRNLAARSAKAANETAELIESSVAKAQRGVDIADQTAGALGQIVDSVTRVTELVTQISSASQEQSAGLNEIRDALSQIDQVTQQTAGSSEESASAAEELSSQSVQLQQMLSRFHLKQGGFPSSSGGMGEEPHSEQAVLPPW